VCDLQQIFVLSSWALIAYSIPVFAGIVLGGEYLLAIFGEAYIEGYEVLVVLSVGQLFNALAGPVGLVMTMTGHQLKSTYILSLAAVINIVLNVLLIPILGLVGAAYATAIVTVAWNLAMLMYVSSQLNLNPSVLCVISNIARRSS